MISADPIFVDATGNNYLVRDVCAAGDCALLALLMSPTFEAPVSGADELRRAIVSFARGEARDDCSTVFSLIGENSTSTFDGYLSEVLQPKFWVGTIAFIWTSMAYGIDIVSHFFNEHKQPASNSTADFLEKHMPKYCEFLDRTKSMHIFFHQYKNMRRCKPSMYNHFATLVPVLPSRSENQPTLNASLQSADTPWWTQVSNVNGYDCTAKDLKGKRRKNKLDKNEQKKLNEALTYHYLNNSDKGLHLASEMSARLEKAHRKEAELAARLKVPIEDLDCGIASVEPPDNKCDEKISGSATLTSKYDRRNWLQRAKIIFIHLYPKMGGRVSADTVAITGVKENTLLSWLVQRKLIACWIDLVQCMTAQSALNSLPQSIQDTFCTVDPESKVNVQRYRNRLTPECQQLKILFKGGKVSSLFARFALLYFCFCFNITNQPSHSSLFS